VRQVRARLAGHDSLTAPMLEHYSQREILATFAGTESDAIYPLVRSHLRVSLNNLGLT